VTAWADLFTLQILSQASKVRRVACRAKKSGSKPAAPAITFADVAGVENAKEELREVGAHSYLIHISIGIALWR
jgi:ATP-dependent Zn protease